MIKTLKEIVVMDNGFLKVHNDRVEFPNKTQGNYYKLTVSDGLPKYGVAGVVITDDNKIVLMENFQYAHQAYGTETVKGFGMHGKTPKEAFEIEMKEEVGYLSDDISEILSIREGSQDFWIYAFVAKNARFDKPEHEGTESIRNIQAYTFDEIQEMILSGKITDSMSLTVLQYALINCRG